MLKDHPLGKMVLAFFLADENRHLFVNCPQRPHLHRLNERDQSAARNIGAHMLGHVLDYRAGTAWEDEATGLTVHAIDQSEIEDELRYIYNDLNNVPLNEARRYEPGYTAADSPDFRGVGPEQHDCFGLDAQAELMAEAIRAYLQDPNYIKTVAPNVAKRIRAAVNTHPELNKIIHFN